MRKYVAAWILGVPIPVVVLVWAMSHVAGGQ
jgi:hypothetical protein